MACTRGISARLSWVLAAEVATASGRPAASVSTCSLAPGLPRSTGFGPVSGPPYLWRDPRATGSVLRPRPSAWSRVGPEPRSRWSARWTNDLDRGEDRRMLFGAEKDEGTSQVNGGSRSGAVAGGCRDRGGCAGARPYQ